MNLPKNLAQKGKIQKHLKGVIKGAGSNRNTIYQTIFLLAINSQKVCQNYHNNS
jgi:hypothetical protein